MPTLEQIQARIEKLRTQEAVLRQKQHGRLIKQIHSMMKQNGLTFEDLQIGLANGGKRGPGRPPNSATNGVDPVKGARAEKVTKAVKSKSGLPAKYRNPQTGETWTGWARPPAWIKDVKDRSKFLINPDAGTGIVLGPRKGKATKNSTAATKTVGARRGRPPSKVA